MILSEGFRKSSLLLAAKRMVDVLASLVLLLLALPIMGVVALAIWLESGSPILFRQERIGLGGRPFQILKFRSMNHNAEEHGPKWAADGDQRVTWVGRVIRRSEEHTSELQSPCNLVCRLLLEKKKNFTIYTT